MTHLIVGYTPNDAELAREVCTVLADLQPVALPLQPEGGPLVAGPRTLAAMIWTPQSAAAGLEEKFRAMAEQAPGRALLLCEGAAAPSSLIDAGAVPTAARQAPEELHRLAHALLKASDRIAPRPVASSRARGAPRRPSAAASAPVVAATAQRKAFSSGMARGFAGSVTMLGLGGAVTLGMAGQFREGVGVGSDHAAASTTGAMLVQSFDATLEAGAVAAPAPDVLAYDDILARAEQLRLQAERDREEISAALAQTTETIDAGRRATQRRVEELKTVAGGGGVFGVDFHADGVSPAAASPVVSPVRAKLRGQTAELDLRGRKDFDSSGA